MIAHVILVIDLAVEQFHNDIDAVPFGQFDHRLQSPGAVVHPDRVVHAVAIAGEGDHVWDPSLSRSRYDLFEIFQQFGMVVRVVEAIDNAQFAAIGNSAL